MQPAERAADVLAVHDRDAAHHRADRGALDKRDHRRTEEESPVPDPAHALAAEAELERDAAEDEAKEQQQHREVERAEEHCIDVGKRREQPGADHHQPSLVAVPERGDGVHHPHPVRLVPGRAEQYADAEIEAVQDDVDQDRAREHASPEQREIGWFHVRHPSLRAVAPVAVSASSANASGRLPVAPGMAFASAVGPSCSSL